MASSDLHVHEIATRFLTRRQSGERLPLDDALVDGAGVDRAALRTAVLSEIVRIRRSGGSAAGSSDSEQLDGMTTVPVPQPPGYDIIDVLGRGGMGVVYEAYQRSTGRRVAVKFMLNAETASAATRRRFEREVELVARLDHPNIVSVIDSGLHDNSYFYVMDYVDGVPLDRWIADFRLQIADLDRRAPARAFVEPFLRIVTVLCDAVDYAHQRGVLHRDLKPSNILVSDELQIADCRLQIEGAATVRGKSAICNPQYLTSGTRRVVPDVKGRSAIPKVLDFGLAKAIELGSAAGKLTLSAPGQLLGTVAYMSPEQSRGQLDQLSVRSDVYSLGAIAYESVTGKLPCDINGPLADVLQRIAAADPPRPSSLVRKLSGDLDAILLKALEKDPARRYATAADFAADIRRYLRGEPVAAHAPSALYRFGKFAHRNKLLVGLSALAVLLLLGGIVGTSVSRARAVAAEREAESRLNESEAVTGFLSDMLASAKTTAKGREVLLREVLDEAAKGIEASDLAPRVEARLRRTIGDTYTDLGDYAAAREHLERTIQIYQHELGEDDINTLRATESLGLVHLLQGRADLAERLFIRCLAEYREQLGADDIGSLMAMANLAQARADQGRLGEAEPLFREALAVQERVLGERNFHTLRTANNLALLLKRSGRLDEAQALYERTLVANREVFGQEHPDTLNTLNNLAAIYAARQRFAEAEALLAPLIEPARRVFGPDHPELLTALNNLGSVYYSTHRLDEAAPLMIETLDARRRVHGPDHPRTLNTLGNIGMLRCNQGRYAEAEPLLVEALAAFRRTLGSDHPSTQAAVENLARLYRDSGRLAEAEPLSQEACDTHRRVSGGDPLNTIRACTHLGEVYLLQGRLESAGPVLEEALNNARRTLPPDHVASLVAMHKLGVVRALGGRYSEAEPLLSEAVARARRALPEGDWQLGLYLREQGACLRELGWFEAAEETLLEALDILRSRLGPSESRTITVIKGLLRLYEAWGRPQQADQYRAWLSSAPTTESTAAPPGDAP